MENEERFKIVSKTEILVDLNAPPKLPSYSYGMKIKENIGDGWVKVEKREAEGPDSGRDELYVDDHRVILYLTEQQKGGKMILGNKVREELIGKPVLHPNILDALLRHQDLIPEGWKKYNGHYIHYIFFWAVTFCDSSGLLYVRCLCFRGGEWDWKCCFLLDNTWPSNFPAALLES